MKRKRDARFAERHRKRQLKWRKDNPALALYRQAKTRAKRLGIQFTIEPKDVVIPTHCPVTGVEFRSSGTRATSPSLDRIVNSLGYVPGNVIVVCYRVNAIKHDASPEELIAIGRFYRRLLKAAVQVE